MTRAVSLALVLLAAVVAGGQAGGGASGVSGTTGGACARPYSATSPWNRPIGASPAYDPRSDLRMRALDGPLISDPREYTFPVYEVTSKTPRRSVRITGWFSRVSAAGRRMRNTPGGGVALPLPGNVRPAPGSDAQVIVLNRSTGEEWGFWRLERSVDSWTATNGYRYSVRWSGVPPGASSGSKFTARGSGIPYLAGLVRPCEIARGRIDHALAFAYDYPAGSFVYPATKSDGRGTDPADLPEGARLQLDPGLTRAQIGAWGCRRACFTIARALQEYGMYVVDNSGHPKVMVEHRGTARWNGMLTSRTVSPIPLDAFKVLRLSR